MAHSAALKPGLAPRTDYANAVQTPIYLDYNATTPVDERVLDAMLPYLRGSFGNAASTQHDFGRIARDGVDTARQQVAELIGAPGGPDEIVFTSGATEADNLAVRGVAEHYADLGRHIITTAVEHPAVIDPCRRLEREGFDVTWLKPIDGSVRAEQVAEAIRDDTILVTVMWANNETGAINDVPGIGAICRDHGAIFHSDATQYVGKLPVDVDAAGIDLLSATAHKFYGPKGAGFLYVRSRKPRVRLAPMMEGGGHEHGMRSGTLNVPGIVGLGMACEISRLELDDESARLAALRDRLEAAVTAKLDNVHVNSPPGPGGYRLPHTWHISFAGIDPAKLMAAIPDLAVSAAAACHTGRAEPSYVLRATGLSDELALASLRISLGRFTTDEQVDYAAKHLIEGVRAL